ncbi:LOW QUALITY PROTEIN: cholesterol transporter ABCA5-like [Lethenteron reissneri]|uniref:LOW QUALITY PROTEIN: cholesterol transporter ABCA5-like n=1 Tax=Lethenteron reissneri TaxID=7753 RepID=UPI002AB69199|nr:LOW QUALITY PROTEIN: cholesterol transporter ABCA5-like [Lethenteron reissneri]
MGPEARPAVGIWGQTKALVYRNGLIKVRNKQQTLQELLIPLCFVLLLVLISEMNRHVELSESPPPPAVPLPLEFDHDVGYVADSDHARRVMYLVAAQLAKPVQEFPTESTLREDVATLHSCGVVFNGSMEYRLLFPYNTVPSTDVAFDQMEMHCRSMDEVHSTRCPVNDYLESGFVSLQLAIDSALIQLQTNVSAHALTSAMVQRMGRSRHTVVRTWPQLLASIYLAGAFAPFLSFLLLNLVLEKEQGSRDLMRTMGLRTPALWLSWALVYGAMICLVSLVLAVVTRVTHIFDTSNTILMFLLFLLYGLSLVAMALVLMAFFRKAKTASSVGSLLALIFCLLNIPVLLLWNSNAVLHWLLSLFSPAAFALAVAQVVALEAGGSGAHFSNLLEGPNPLAVPLTMLLLDIAIYVGLAAALHRLLPEAPASCRPSFFRLPRWRRSAANGGGGHPPLDVLDDVALGGPGHGGGEGREGDGICEAVPSEMLGSEAIRIRNVSKTYRLKGTDVMALRGLSLNIYEGQITALLGHNGAGKTTLINILTGLITPSAGSVTIFGLRVDDRDELSALRTSCGFCPQSDILFSGLTAREQLRVFALLKPSVAAAETEAEVSRVLSSTGLEKAADKQVQDLSGGQKRKLSLAAALLGNPRLLILDEPTSGMDPVSRRRVWSLLLGGKRECVTLLSTHSMEEADALADWKAVLSQGRLKCAGSSLFLKTKFGVGYRLTMCVGEECNPEEVTALVLSHVPSARLARRFGAELAYTLPFNDVRSFTGLFSVLDTRTDLCVHSYGVSMTTLEEVFLRLWEESEMEQPVLADYSVFADAETAGDGQGARGDIANGDGIASTSEDDSTSDLGSLHLLTYDPGNSGEAPRPGPLTGWPLWCQQLRAVAWLRVISYLREYSSLVYLVVTPAIFIGFAIWLAWLGDRMDAHQPAALRLWPGLYLLGTKGGMETAARTRLLVLTSAESGLSEATIGSLQSLEVQLDLSPGSRSHNLALNLTQQGPQGVTGQYNSTALHSLPVLVNLLSNWVLRSLNGTGVITTWSQPLPRMNSSGFTDATLVPLAMFIGLGANWLPCYFIFDIVRDRELQARSLMRISGLAPSAYWLGLASVDLASYSLLLLALLATAFGIGVGSLTQPGAALALIICLVGSAPATLLFTYVCSFLFSKMESVQTAWPLIAMLLALAPYLVVTLLESAGELYGLATALHHVFALCDPLYVLIGNIYYVLQVYLRGKQRGAQPTLSDYFAWDSNIPITLLAPYVMVGALWLALMFLERRPMGHRDVHDPVFCISGRRRRLVANTERPEGEDEDVAWERERVKRALHNHESPAMLVHSLRKEFGKSQSGCHCRSGRGKACVAVRNLSFMVERGEVLGLLGPNGAGKTTTVELLAGELKPSAGQVVLGDGCARGAQLGLCPQVNPLWKKLTLAEHLSFYAAVRGLRRDEARAATQGMISALALKEHAEKVTRKLSGGTKRKLCFALSMLGGPCQVLLDEPSMGMDPKTKRFMWRAIGAAFRSSQRGAVLTTHYMEEAEALCHRVAIVVAGRLRCLGSIQHLKSKYGGCYHLEVKVGEATVTGASLEQRVAEVQAHLASSFPGASLQDGFAGRLVYKVPREHVGSLAEVFNKLEKAKLELGVEEYSFSQATLEQVFVEFVKEQSDTQLLLEPGEAEEVRWSDTSRA